MKIDVDYIKNIDFDNIKEALYISYVFEKLVGKYRIQFKYGYDSKKNGY